ncbi:MAG TPA: nucleotidyltransferase domain-containing protein, partial [Waddliaceae bacterium]
IKRIIFTAFNSPMCLFYRLQVIRIKTFIPFLFGFIYGSTASGKESANSDIDLFIVGDLGLRDLANILSEARKNLRREINSTVYSEKELKEKIKERNPFIQQVLHRPRIWLMGDENEFKKMDKRGSFTTTFDK